MAGYRDKWGLLGLFTAVMARGFAITIRLHLIKQAVGNSAMIAENDISGNVAAHFSIADLANNQLLHRCSPYDDDFPDCVRLDYRQNSVIRGANQRTYHLLFCYRYYLCNCRQQFLQDISTQRLTFHICKNCPSQLKLK
jgi:hypothetical protein